MPVFIKLTDEDGIQFLLNASFIQQIEELENTGALIFCGHGTYEVKETPKEVYMKIADEIKYLRRQ